jgi:hypothetical protein
MTETTPTPLPDPLDPSWRWWVYSQWHLTLAFVVGRDSIR